MEKTLIVMFTVWATCVQASPEQFAIWIVIIKLLEFARRRIVEAMMDG